MPDIVGIRFKSCGKIYEFDANDLGLQKGDKIVIDSEFGLSIGTVVEPPHPVEGSRTDLKRVLRVASNEDFKQKTDNEKFEQEAKSFCYERVMARGLLMKLVRAEATLDRKRIVFYFTADGRIDFRELVKDLAARFKTRIEMRQIGVRDKAKLVGGFGLCGQELCCKAFLSNFEPISIKMAKQQDLTLNTGKLSGACGRLMCCLGYEYHEGSSAPGSQETGLRIKEESLEPLIVPEEVAASEGETEEPSEEAAKEPETPAPAEKAAQQQPGNPHKRRRRRRNKKRQQKPEVGA
jgi:cell fate regulator YaaT (PSP1 superfamily)